MRASFDYLGEMLISMRKERKGTQQELGMLLGVAPSQISRWERCNYHCASMDTIAKIPGLLEYDVSVSTK